MMSRTAIAVAALGLVTVSGFYSAHLFRLRETRDPQRPSSYLRGEGGHEFFFCQIIKSVTGNDPSERLQAGEITTREILQSAARSNPQAISPQPIDDYLSRNPGVPAVLTGNDGNGWVVLNHHAGQVGDPSLQMVSAENMFMDIAVQELPRFGFQTAWVLHGSLELSFQLDDTQIVFDRGWHSFGLVKPQQDLEAIVSVTNRGPDPVVIGRIRASCGCLAVSPKEGFELQPGASKSIVVQLSSGSSEFFHQSIAVPLRKSAATTSQVFEFHVCGSVKKSAIVYPSSLGFGNVSLTNAPIVKRQFWVQETLADRFDVLSVSPSCECVSVTFAETTLPRGLKRFDFDVEFAPSSLEPAAMTGQINIETTSLLQPHVVVPYTAQVIGPIAITPRTIAFGSAPATETLTTHVDISSTSAANPADISVSVESAPEWCQAEVHSETDRTVVLLTATAQGKGLHEGILRLRLTCGQYVTVESLPCVATFQ